MKLLEEGLIKFSVSPKEKEEDKLSFDIGKWRVNLRAQGEKMLHNLKQTDFDHFER